MEVKKNGDLGVVIVVFSGRGKIVTLIFAGNLFSHYPS